MYGSADADRGGYAGVPRVYREAYIQEGVPVSLLPWWVWGGIPSLPPPSLRINVKRRFRTLGKPLCAFFYFILRFNRGFTGVSGRE